jgi:parvulin-like peptidyl-prolyl isomerase
VPLGLATPRTMAPKFTLLAGLPQRALLLPALGLAVGLLMAGVALFHKAPGPLTTVPPGYVALVNQKGILMSDFMMQTATEAEKPFDQTTPAERHRVLREMIDQELMVQRALVLDLPETTTQVRDVLDDAVRAQIVAPFLASPPTDAELRRYYDAHREKYAKGGTMLLRDLVLHIGGYENADQSLSQAQSDASEAVYQLRAGSSAEYVMEHFGFVDSARTSNTEQLEFAAKLLLGEKLYAVAATLADGEISAPIVDSDGVHILIMQQRRPPTLADFNSVREQVYNDYRLQENDRAVKENLAMLRGQAQILLAPGRSE